MDSLSGTVTLLLLTSQEEAEGAIDAIRAEFSSDPCVTADWPFAESSPVSQSAWKS